MLLFVNENSEWELNPMPERLYLCLPWSTFLVIFSDPNKQLFNAKSAFKFLSCGFSL